MLVYSVALGEAGKEAERVTWCNMVVSLEGEQPSHSVSLAVPGGGTEPLGRRQGSTVLDPRALVLGRDPCPSLTQTQQGNLPASDHLGGFPGDTVVKNSPCSAGGTSPIPGP